MTAGVRKKGADAAAVEITGKREKAAVRTKDLGKEEAVAAISAAMERKKDAAKRRQVM